MPLIYGEGRKAFMRLQVEILEKVDDDSLYAWAADIEKSGLLATWPTAFANSGDIVQFNFPEDPIPWLPPTMTSLGLEIRGRYSRHDPHQEAIEAQHGVMTISTSLFAGNDDQMLVMYCSPCGPNDIPITQEWRNGDVGRALLIRLKRFGATWQRVNCKKLEFTLYSEEDTEKLNAFLVSYVEQQGLQS